MRRGMKLNTRTTALLLAAVLLFGMIPVTAFAAEDLVVTVVDQAGTPITGASVSVSVRLFGTACNVEEAGGGSYNVTSSRYGQFLGYAVTVEKEGYETASAEFEESDGGVRITLTAAEPVGYTMTVKVLDQETGEAVPGATVSYTDGGETEGTGTTGDDGADTFSVPDGTYTVTAEAVGYSSGEAECTVSGDDAEVTVYLSAVAYTVSVMVLDNETKEPVLGATVTYDDGTATEVGEGRYTFSATTGTYTVNARADGYEAGSSTVSVTNSDTSVAVYVTPVTQEYTVTVTVIDAQTQEPVEDATVTYDGGTAAGADGGIYTFSAKDGVYDLTVTAAGYEKGHGTATVSGSDAAVTVDLTPEDPDAEYIIFEIFYIATGELPSSYTSGGDAADYGPSGNDVPLVEIQVDINALKQYTDVVAYEEQSTNSWYFTPVGETGDLDAAIRFWDAVLACTTEDSIAAFKATGLFEQFVGYCLKEQGWNGGDYHGDGILNVTPPVYVIELYCENTYVGGSVTDQYMEFKTIEDVLASLEGYVGQNITWNRDTSGNLITTDGAYTGTYIIDHVLYEITVTQTNQRDVLGGEIYYYQKSDQYFLAQFDIAVVGSGQKIQYKVTYTDGVDGEAFEDQEFAVESGSTPHTFTGSTDHGGYIFAGWRLDSDGQIYQDAQIADMTVSSDMVFTAVYEEVMKVVFHANNAAYTGDDAFRVYYPQGTVLPEGAGYLSEDGKITAFYDIPTFDYQTHNSYIFMGWYMEDETPVDWESAYTQDTHIYAHWITVGQVTQEAADTKILDNGGIYHGYDLIGTQIRSEETDDLPHYGEAGSGLRFITVLSEDVYGKINALNSQNASGAEYGFVVAKTNTAIKYCGEQENYTLQYKGENVNGVDTTTAYKYVQNMKCSGTVNGEQIADHFDGEQYRLYTAVITYKGLEGDALTQAHETPFVARSYIRYYDANGLLRTYYNNYTGTQVYHGCSASYSDVLAALSGTNGVN